MLLEFHESIELGSSYQTLLRTLWKVSKVSPRFHLLESITLTPYVRPPCFVGSVPRSKTLYDHWRLNFPENVTSRLTGFTFPSKGGHYELSEIRIKAESRKNCQAYYRMFYKAKLPPGLLCAKALYNGMCLTLIKMKNVMLILIILEFDSFQIQMNLHVVCSKIAYEWIRCLGKSLMEPASSRSFPIGKQIHVHEIQFTSFMCRHRLKSFGHKLLHCKNYMKHCSK